MFDPVATVFRHHNNAMSYTVILAFFGQKSHEIFWNLRNTTHCDSAVVSLCRSLFTRHQALWLVSLYRTEVFFLRKFSLLYRNDLTCRPEVRLQSIPPVEDVDRHVVMLYGQQRGGWCSSPPSPQQLKGVVHKRRPCDFSQTATCSLKRENVSWTSKEVGGRKQQEQVSNARMDH